MHVIRPGSTYDNLTYTVLIVYHGQSILQVSNLVVASVTGPSDL